MSAQPPPRVRGLDAVARTAVHAFALVRMPLRVAVFYLRACRLARRRGDAWSLRSAARPREIRALLNVGRGARHVVEVGTGTAWTAIALALAEPQRRIVTFDKIARPEADRYLELAALPVRSRITRVTEEAAAAAARHDGPVDFLFLDGGHTRDVTIALFEAWRPHLAPGAVVAFHDWNDPTWPGVKDATDALGLDGQATGHLFVWRAPAQ